MRNNHEYLDQFKRRMAIGVLQAADMNAIRQKSLANINRWNANGVWVSAYDEWRELMTNGTDAEVISAMTGSDPKANRLRQSAPYVGILDDVTRAYLWETRQVEDDADVASKYPSINAQKLLEAKKLLGMFDVAVIRQKSLYFLERLLRVTENLSATHQEWSTLLTVRSDDEIIAVMTGNDERAVRLRLVNPFDDLLHMK